MSVVPEPRRSSRLRQRDDGAVRYADETEQEEAPSKRGRTAKKVPKATPSSSSSGASSTVATVVSRVAQAAKKSIAKAQKQAAKVATPSTEAESDSDDAETQRLRVMLRYEEEIWQGEWTRLQSQDSAGARAQMQTFAIVGVDEVGVGPLAGPCMSAAVALRHLPLLDDEDDRLQRRQWRYGRQDLYDLNDSKKLKQHQRERLASVLQTTDMAFHSLGICTSQEVDQLNPRAASMEAMRRAVTQLLEGPLRGYRVHLLVDYHTVPDMPPQVVGQTCLTKGDAKSQSIAAASVLAKVHRDAYMLRLHQQYPQFGFDRNVGYGTREHMNALRDGQLCPEHRLSFAPVRAAYDLQKQQMLPSPNREEEKVKSVGDEVDVPLVSDKRTTVRKLKPSPSRLPLLPNQPRASLRADEA